MAILLCEDKPVLAQVEGYMYCNSQNRMRMRMYHCFTDIKLHQRFAPMVSGPDRLYDMKPHVVSLSPP